MRSTMPLTAVVSAVTLAALVLVDRRPTAAQASPLTQWVPGSSIVSANVDEDDVPISPAVAADASGQLHVVWGVAAPPGRDAIYYAHGDGASWSAPREIVIGPTATAKNTSPTVIVDSEGFLHVFWGNSGIYHSRAHVSEADEVSGWSTPIAVSPGQLALIPFARADADGVLHVLLATLDGVPNVYYVRSEDSGSSWSDPVNVSGIAEEQGASEPRLFVAPDGTLHVVWSQGTLPSGWPPAGVYYARSVDQGATWTSPTQLAGDWESNGAVLQTQDGTLHVVWGGTGERSGRYASHSEDNGDTWSAPVQVSGAEFGMSGVGELQLAEDSAGNLFWCSQGRDAAANGDRIRCSTWDRASGGWSAPRRVSAVEGAEMAEEAPVMALVLGNRLHLIWQASDNSQGVRDLVDYTLETGAPGLSAAPWPTLPAAVAATSPADAATRHAETERTPDSTATRLPEFSRNLEDTGGTNGGILLFFALVPALMVILFVFSQRKRI